MSTTLRSPEVGTAPPVHRHLTTALWVVVGVLAAALVALGAWMVVDRYTGPQHDATTMFDDLTSAWSNYDEAAIRSLYAPNAIQVGADGSETVGAEAIAAQTSMTQMVGFQVERVAPVTVEGDMSATFVRAWSGGGADKVTWLTVLQTKDGKILRHWDFEAGVGALENAVMP